MKKRILLVLVITILFTGLCCFAAANNIIQFNSKNFTLKYARVSPAVTMNEYYLSEEKEYDWTELVTLLKINQMNDPLIYANRLSQSMPMSKIIPTDNEKAYIVSFMSGQKLKDGTFYIEPNVLKVAKCKKSGLCTIQYAQKYICKNQDEARARMNSYYANDEKQFINLITKARIPAILEKDYQEW